jgi:ribosomal protein L14E/L6E/L27E
MIGKTVVMKNGRFAGIKGKIIEEVDNNYIIVELENGKKKKKNVNHVIFV